jgi:F-type H+-transporting ATPase subunit epsilon
MADGVKIEIVSPERLLVSEVATSITIPGTEGYLTVMGDHAPLMTTLRPGFISASMSGGTRSFFVRGGFADITPELVTILAEEAMPMNEFNSSVIESGIQSAEAELAAATTDDAKSLASDRLYAWRNLGLEVQQGVGGSLPDHA